MRFTIAVDESQAEKHLPDVWADASGVGINCADQILRSFRRTLPDGRNLLAKRKGLKIALTIEDRLGEAILRRLKHGPGVRNIFRNALTEAACNAGAEIVFELHAIHLDLAE